MTEISNIDDDFDTLISEEILGVEEEKNDDELVIDEPYDPAQIKVTTEKKTIDLVIRRIKHGEIDLAPEFQRRARLWPINRRSQLIESLLLRIPLPVFYVAANPNDDWVVVDGLQRITTISDFIEGRFKLSGLEYLKGLEDLDFNGLDRIMKRRIEETEIVINIIQPGTAEEVMMNIFKRINTGGVPLNSQEIRNAINKGPARSLLRELAQAEEFKLATDNSIRDTRMDAQEMVLRFLAFRINPWTEYKANKLDAYLNTAMRQLNTMSEQELESLSNDFKLSMTRSFEIFGKNCFRKNTLTGRRSPISKPLFEAWSVNLAALNDEEFSELARKKDQLIIEHGVMLSYNIEYIVAITYSTGVPKRVISRFQEVQELIRKVIREDDNDY
ncbi:DUF262 domain-containing protein [Pseudomonas frederiksbergensis]|uniref:DUF262 domain-containing protein n=1 Tax=Pseudomonas frederiksbergensis TaxID=104087 RepID=UPI003D1A1BCC